MSIFNLSVESMSIIYPMMFLFGLMSYVTYKLTNIYYTTLIDNNYDIKPKDNLSKYFVLKMKLASDNSYREDEVEHFITTLMYKLNTVTVYRYYDRIYFMIRKEDTINYSISNIKDTLNTLSQNYSFTVNYNGFDFIKKNQILKYFKNLFYRNKFLWVKHLSKTYNIPFKNKDVEYFVRRNLNKIKNELPTYGQFYKFDNNSGVISFKLYSFKTHIMYERLITIESIELHLLKIFSAFDEHYIENTDVDVYNTFDMNNETTNELDKKMDEFDDLIKTIVKNVLESETDEAIEATIVRDSE